MRAICMNFIKIGHINILRDSVNRWCFEANAYKYSWKPRLQSNDLFFYLIYAAYRQCSAHVLVQWRKWRCYVTSVLCESLCVPRCVTTIEFCQSISSTLNLRLCKTLLQCLPKEIYSSLIFFSMNPKSNCF